MTPRDLMEATRVLTEFGRGHPTRVRLRRAVSTTYYAMFHCPAAMAANLFIGRTRGTAWHRAYCALGHGGARIACREERTMRGFPAEIRDFAEAFVALQKVRQQADYALNTDAYQKSYVLAYIASAELAISPVRGGGHRGAASPPMCFSGNGHRRRTKMSE